MNQPNKVMVIAFDGMDFDLIKEYELQQLTNLEEFGKIDNQKGMKTTFTSELYASFITGKNWEEHGIKGLRSREYGSKWVEKLNENLRELWIGRKITGLRRSFLQTFPFIQYRTRKWTKEDLNSKTIFDKVVGKPLHVPSYNPEPEWMCGFPLKMLEQEFSASEVEAKSWELTKERLDDFWNLNHDFWEFIMLQVHEPDILHHLTVDKDLVSDDEMIKMYSKLDDVANQVIDKFGEDYVIIFMSDHGLPQGGSHNENAFYACNYQLFGSKEPKITDFHDKILEVIKNENEEPEEVDV
ncbi:MAG: alkaline phosphatase family protein [Candidatus Nanohalobium sp.]